MTDQATIDRACNPQVGDVFRLGKWTSEVQSVGLDIVVGDKVNQNSIPRGGYADIIKAAFRSGSTFTPSPNPPQPVDKRCGTCGLWNLDQSARERKGIRWATCAWTFANPTPYWVAQPIGSTRPETSGRTCACWRAAK